MILRRRVCLFVQTWCSLKIAAEHRPGVYDVLARLLDRPEPLIVRLAAAKALQASTTQSDERDEHSSPAPCVLTLCGRARGAAAGHDSGHPTSSARRLWL